MVTPALESLVRRHEQAHQQWTLDERPEARKADDRPPEKVLTLCLALSLSLSLSLSLLSHSRYVLLGPSENRKFPALWPVTASVLPERVKAVFTSSPHLGKSCVRSDSRTRGSVHAHISSESCGTEHIEKGGPMAPFATPTPWAAVDLDSVLLNAARPAGWPI